MAKKKTEEVHPELLKAYLGRQEENQTILKGYLAGILDRLNDLENGNGGKTQKVKVECFEDLDWIPKQFVSKIRGLSRMMECTNDLDIDEIRGIAGILESYANDLEKYLIAIDADEPHDHSEAGE